MNFPNELKYTKHDEWVKMIDDTTALVGITDFAQDQLSDIVFVTLPEVGDEAVADEKYGDVESTKAVSDLVSPVSGTICEVNTELDDSPELLNEDPYANWIIKVENVTEEEALLNAADYEAHCAEEG